jgi:ADP-heptose:LPS heptosyltransferase
MKRILVIRLGALGDLVHVSPSLALVKSMRPDAEIHLLTHPAYDSLVQMMPGVDRVWHWDKKTGWSGLLALAKDLRQAEIDAVVNLHPSFKTMLLAGLVTAKWPAVYHKQKLRVKGRMQREMARRHAVEDFYQPFKRLLKLPETPTLVPSLLLRKEEQSADIKAIRKSVGERWIGLIPGVGGKRGNRAWESASWQALIVALLRTPENRLLLIGGPDESALASALQTAVGDTRLENHCGRHDLPGTSRLLVQCECVIGGDTGPTHLAAGLGVPVIGLFGPTNPVRTGPRGQANMQLLTPPEALTCWPCEAPECPLSGEDYMACMRQIPVDAVMAACRDLLG